MCKLTIISLKTVVLSGLIILTTACQAPPLFTSAISEIALAGFDVDIQINVAGEPNTMSCDMNGTVVMQSEDGFTYTGTIPQHQLDVGENIVHCSASNDGGTLSLPVGLVVVIPNITPAINTISDRSVYDNDGTVTIDINLMSAGGDNLVAITYSLKTGAGYDSLPDGLALNPANGRLQGTVDVDGTQALTLALVASNLAGSDTSNPFTLTINDGSP